MWLLVRPNKKMNCFSGPPSSVINVASFIFFICQSQTINVFNFVICHISGVYLISRSGPVQTSFLWPWLAAMSLFPVTYIFPDKRPITIILTTAVGAYFSMECAKWDEDVIEEDGYQHSMKRLMVVFLALMLHGSLWSSFLYFNVTVMSMNGTMVSIFNTKISSLHF